MTEAARPAPQIEASDPRRSAWVSANAGSGKTTVLVRRVIRLLLDGVPPGRILCLTYTKAAAAHMANKVLETLSGWVRLNDTDLDAEIKQIEPGVPDAPRRARARRLFAAALETPGGLKVQTIHAFCDRVLHMFPVEANAPAGFEVLDELGERDMIENARLQVLLDAGRNPASPLGQALAHCVEISSDLTIEKVIAEAVLERRKLARLDLDAARHALLAALELDPDSSSEYVRTRILSGGTLPQQEWQATALALQALGTNAAKMGAALLEASKASESEKLDAYLGVFFTDKGEPKADTTLGAKKDLATIPAISQWLFAERGRLIPLVNQLRATMECERSCALLAIAAAVVERYEAAKRQRGVLDFADLVTKTVELLEREASAWVHYKLDGGIDHILVDEAQDTSPEQWRIIAKLAEEFFAGKGASERTRTIFAVGDERQSIFSFQGADPKRFDEMRRTFESLISAAGGLMNKPSLLNSFRSTATVLNAVDKIFLSPEAHRGLFASDNVKPVHNAVRQNAPGMVEVWEPIKAEKNENEDDGWDKPYDRARESSAPALLADQIAKAVKHWTSGGLSVADRKNGERPRPVTAGDIIILVQSRGVLFDAILRALKKANVEVAGADRLKLTENIAVMDLMALGDALLLREDDLSLACVLKSPLFELTDDDLFALCHNRKGALADSLAATSDEHYRNAARLLARWREQALHLRPFDFYSRVLGRDGGRKKMIARLGPEAADALDEFLAAALSYESSETPSLYGFLSYLRRAQAEVKRDLETESKSVRVMTVHGVKGLEAPVVVLADTTSLPSATKEPRVMPLSVANADKTAAPFVWAARKEDSSQIVLDARESMRDLRRQEYRRLLYVALTRAEDVLVVCGALNGRQKEAEKGSWYNLVYSALAEDSKHIKKLKVGYSEEEILRWRTPEPAAIAALRKDTPPISEKNPDWLIAAAPPAEASRNKRRPSSGPEDFTRSGDARPGGRQRGILVHRLLQSLPDLQPEQREAAAQRYLALAAPAISDSEKADLAREALRVIADPACSEIFGPGSRAEPELIARIPGANREIEISARIDRLAVSEQEVVFGDFKSDAAVPASAGAIPEHYVSQLAAYRAALLAAFPGKRIRALLIFTAAPRVFEIPEESLESAWQRLKTQWSPASV
jgi:ATP-dependent helicase/nuclease subunit A